MLKIPIHKLDKRIFSFKRKNEAASRNIKILASFKGNLGADIAAQNYIALKYISEFRNTVELSILSYYHEDKRNIINIIQQGLSYHLDPINRKTRKSYLDAMVLNVNHKPSHS